MPVILLNKQEAKKLKLLWTKIGGDRGRYDDQECTTQGQKHHSYKLSQAQLAKIKASSGRKKGKMVKSKKYGNRRAFPDSFEYLDPDQYVYEEQEPTRPDFTKKQVQMELLGVETQRLEREFKLYRKELLEKIDEIKLENVAAETLSANQYRELKSAVTKFKQAAADLKRNLGRHVRKHHRDNENNPSHYRSANALLRIIRNFEARIAPMYQRILRRGERTRGLGLPRRLDFS